jgi:NACHT domain- and WD repeat-containing protein
MVTLGKTFRIFVSSTFSDLIQERNALQEKVFPRLRDLCRQHGCRFQAIDLRWGVREEAGLDQQAMKICLGEIERCQKTTPRPNFIILLGERYGWRPLPPEIPAAEYEAILKALPGGDGSENGSLLRHWYRLDDNAVPPIRYLSPRKIDLKDGASEEERRQAAKNESQAWRKVEGRLRGVLCDAVAALDIPADRKALYFASATEQEIEAGAMKALEAEKHVHAFFRTIEGLPHDESAGDYVDLNEAGGADVDAQDRLTGLKSRLKARLGDNVHAYGAEWRDGAVSTRHIEALCEDVWQSLSGVIRSELAQMQKMDPLEKEITDHEAFGRERTRCFFGRETYLQRVAAYMKEKDPRPLAVFGASGSGKSALMAQALEGARRDQPSARVVARFLGATPSSSDIRALLESLCRQITRAYGGDEASLPGEYKDLAAEFPKRLALATAERPLVLFLDAVDQLSDSHNGRNLLWLPAALPAHARLVVSTAPADCWDVLQRKVPEAGRVELLPMPAAEGGRILDSWLLNADRTLRPAQRDEVLGKFATSGLPLYLKFAFEEARHWRSDADRVDLDPEVSGIIKHLFARLSQEAVHGKILVSRGLAYLRAGKNGLSEDEMIDVLSRDEAVFGDFEKRSFFKPPERKLPVVVWSRFYFDLEPYLNERSADGASLLGFFHRQMGEAVDAESLAGEDRARIHARLADYYTGQPLFADKDGQRVPNLRKLSELPFQQARGELWEALYETLTDFEFLEAKCTYSGAIQAPEGETGRKLYSGVYELIEDYQRALAVFPADK